MLCDASPKAFKDVARHVLTDTCMEYFVKQTEKPTCEVWIPIVGVNDIAVAWTLQKMSDLMRSEAADEVKLQEAQKIQDSMASKMIETDERDAVRAKM